MKKIFLLIMMIVSCKAVLRAQSKIDDYQSIYFNKSFDINASQDKNDTSKYDYYINCSSMDKLHDDVCLDFSNKRLNDFVDFLNSARQVYIKWSETAKTNNVSELDKQIDIKPFKCSSAFIYGKWNFDFNVLLTPRVKIVDGKILLILSSGELQSSTNEFIKHDGFVFVFTSSKEIDDFVNRIDIKNVKAFFTDKNKKDQLFKN